MTRGSKQTEQCKSHLPMRSQLPVHNAWISHEEDLLDWQPCKDLIQRGRHPGEGLIVCLMEVLQCIVSTSVLDHFS